MEPKEPDLLSFNLRLRAGNYYPLGFIMMHLLEEFPNIPPNVLGQKCLEEGEFAIPMDKQIFLDAIQNAGTDNPPDILYAIKTGPHKGISRGTLHRVEETNQKRVGEKDYRLGIAYAIMLPNGQKNLYVQTRTYVRINEYDDRLAIIFDNEPPETSINQHIQLFLIDKRKETREERFNRRIANRHLMDQERLLVDNMW